MQEEIDNFFIEHDKSLKEKTKLLIDFQEESIETNSIITFNKMEIIPKLKTIPKENKIIVRTEVVNFKKTNKHNLF